MVKSIKINKLLTELDSGITSEDFTASFSDIFYNSKKRINEVRLAQSLLCRAQKNSTINLSLAKSLSRNLLDADFELSPLNNFSGIGQRKSDSKSLKSFIELPHGRSYPKISVITPSFNQGIYIEETILSVINQDYPNFEYIVIDGGSNDNTVNIINKYKNNIDYFVTEKDKGQSDALNKGFTQATGDIFCWINSDDQLSPGALKAVAMAFSTHDVDIVSGIVEIFKDESMIERHMSSCHDGVLPLDDLLDLDNCWNVGKFFYQPEVFFTKRIWDISGGYVQTNFFYSMDYELWLRFAFNKARLHVIGVPLAKFRVHENQKTHQVNKFNSELKIVRDKFVSDNQISNLKTRNNSTPKNLKILFINDHGFKYGAGIGHKRIFEAFKIAGWTVVNLSLSEFFDNLSGLKSDLLLDKCAQISPDLIVFGNTHGISPDSIDFISDLLEKFPVLWVTHDFWIITGKCPYTNGCEKYKDKCSSECPAIPEYPIVKESIIEKLYYAKKKLLSHHNFYILANSDWARSFILNSNNSIVPSKISVFNLGLDYQEYELYNKQSARKFFDIGEERFVIAFSASSISDIRKGGKDLFDALREIDDDNVTLLVIGNIDSDINFSGLNVVRTGYLTDPIFVAVAMKASNIYIGLSKEETFGQVYIESAMAGTPAIGLNRSGIVSAISNGVTGKLITPEINSVVSVLRSAIRGDGLFEHINSWAPVFARNEFSLEASYHSIFCALIDLGIVDKFQLPLKIALNAVPKMDNNRYLVNFPSGFSNEEGPYFPSYSKKFRWLHGDSSEVVFNSTIEGIVEFEFAFINPLFDSIRLALFINGDKCDDIIIRRNDESTLFIYNLKRAVSLNRVVFKFKPDLQLSSKSESRPLTVMLYNFSAKF